MMKIKGAEGLTNDQVRAELARGGRFVLYNYCISIVFMSVKRSSSIHYIRPHQNAIVRGLGFSALTFLLGWWGFPSGPMLTVQALWTNFAGGRDVTDDVMSAIVKSGG